MMSQFRLESLDFKADPEHKNILLKISAIAESEMKKDLAYFLADPTIGLLEFFEVRLYLEELFKQMIH